LPIVNAPLRRFNPVPDMLSRYFDHPWGWTTLAPIACAAHCLATPVLAVSAPALFSSATLEWGFLSATVLLAAAAFGSGIRTHGDLRPLLPLLVGIAMWSASLAGAFAPVAEEVTTMAASLTAAVGMVWNSRLHCVATRDECHACQAELTEAAGVVRSPCAVDHPVSG